MLIELITNIFFDHGTKVTCQAWCDALFIGKAGPDLWTSSAPYPGRGRRFWPFSILIFFFMRTLRSSLSLSLTRVWSFYLINTSKAPETNINDASAFRGHSGHTYRPEKLQHGVFHVFTLRLCLKKPEIFPYPKGQPEAPKLKLNIEMLYVCSSICRSKLSDWLGFPKSRRY